MTATAALRAPKVPFVESDQVRHIWDLVDRLRARRQSIDIPSENEHLLVTAPTGYGKSTCAAQYCRRHPTTEHTTDTDAVTLRPVVYVECPSAFTVKTLYHTVLAHGYDLHIRINEHTETFLDILHQQIEVGQTELIIIDDVQHVLSVSRFVQPMMESLKALTSTVNVVLWLSGLPDAMGLLNRDEQYQRRFHHVSLTEYDAATVTALLPKMPVAVDPSVSAIIGQPAFARITVGKMWRLCAILRWAAEIALERNTVITEAILGDAVAAHMDSHPYANAEISTRGKMP